MPKFVRNINTESLVNVEDAQLLNVKPMPISTGVNGFSVNCYRQPGIGYKLAEFSKKEDAVACLKEVVEFAINGEGVLRVEDVVEKSVIQIPSTFAGGQGNTTN